MDELESKTVPEMTPAKSDLASQVESLRQTLTSALVLTIVISATLNVYLWRQVKYTRADLESFRASATQTVSDFEKVSAPMLNRFLASLAEFGKSPRADAGFHAIMKKYGVVNPTNAPGGAASAPTSIVPAPAPAPAPAKK